MKQILIYTSPAKKFNKEYEALARIQIDNSLELGWKPNDIFLAANFAFIYNGVSSYLLPDGLYYDFDLAAGKSKVLRYLFDKGMIAERELYWCHDFDAYENAKIKEDELGLDKSDLGLVPYFYKPEWQFSSLFLKHAAKDIIELLDNTIQENPRQSRNNEKTLTWLIKHNKIDRKRYKKLNITYGIQKRCLATIYRNAKKPIKVLHFLPSNYDKLMPDTALNMFMYGKNSLKMPIMNDRLIKIFHYHGIR